MYSELCKDFYVVYQLEMVAGEVESSCELVVTFFFFFLVSPYQTIEISLGQLNGAPPHINYFLRRCCSVQINKGNRGLIEENTRIAIGKPGLDNVSARSVDYTNTAMLTGIT